MSLIRGNTMQVIYGVHPVAEALRNGGKIEKIVASVRVPTMQRPR